METAREMNETSQNVQKKIGPVWRCIKMLLILVPVVGVTFFTFKILHDKSNLNTITPRYHVYKYNLLNRYRVKDLVENRWVPGWLSSFNTTFGSDSLLRVASKKLFCSQELYGYMDLRSGKIVIKPQFTSAGHFSEGLAPVVKDGKTIFIDITGNAVVSIDCPIHNMGTFRMRNGYAVVKGDGKSGIITRSGEWALKPIYTDITICTHNTYIVEQDGRYGFWSQSKKWLYKTVCDKIEELPDYQGISVTNDGLRHLIDYDGNVINSLTYDWIDRLAHPVLGKDEEYKINSCYAAFSIDAKYGLMDIRTGEVLIRAIYDNIEMLSENVFCVGYAGQYYIVDKNGNVIGEK